MSKILPELHYTKDHEWARLEHDGSVVVGITDYAQESLGEIVYVDVPSKGTDVTKEEAFGVIESTKSVSDLLAPVSGEIAAQNTIVADSPEVCNEDPYEEGWLVKITPDDPSDLDDLMTADEYEDFVGSLS